MNINRIRRFLLLLAFAVSAQAMGQAAQSDRESTEGLGEARQLLQMGREDIIRDEIRMSEAEAVAFWPVYDSYLGELTIVRDRYAEVLDTYLIAYRAGTVSEELAAQLVDDYLEIQSDILRIKKKYLKDFRKALPPRMAARFFQLENKMEIELEAQLATVVPLIDPV